MNTDRPDILDRLENITINLDGGGASAHVSAGLLLDVRHELMRLRAEVKRLKALSTLHDAIDKLAALSATPWRTA